MMRFDGLTAKVPHWLFGSLIVEDWGDHWRFTAMPFGFMLTWYRSKRVELHLFRDCLWPSLQVRYVGTPMNERGRKQPALTLHWE